MKAMILAAGRGERMRPLTDHTPKPLLEVKGTPLLGWHLSALASAGFSEVVINVSHLAEQIVRYCQDGSKWGLTIAYSLENEALETAGGIARALPLLGDAPFLVVNGDVWTDCDFAQLKTITPPAMGAHLVMVDNPAHHQGGDFVLVSGHIRRVAEGEQAHTYSGVGVYTLGFFESVGDESLPLRPLLETGIDAGVLQGHNYQGCWEDVGTPERLVELNGL